MSAKTHIGKYVGRCLFYWFLFWVFAIMGIPFSWGADPDVESISPIPKEESQEKTEVPPFDEHTSPPQRSTIYTIHAQDALKDLVPQRQVIMKMMATGIMQIKESGKWNFETNDTIGIKVYSLDSGVIGTNPEVVRALILTLVTNGISKNQLIIWDRNKSRLSHGGFVALGKELGVEVCATTESGYDTNTFYTSFFPASLVAGDVEFRLKNHDPIYNDKFSNVNATNEVGRRSFVSNLVSKRLSKIISVTPLIHHNTIGVAGHLYSVAGGCTDNFLRFDLNGERLAEAVPEIYAIPEVGDKVVFCVTDALFCQYRGQNSGMLHYSAPINEIRFSTDPIALDWQSFQTMLNVVGKITGQRTSWQSFSPTGKELCENAVLLWLGTASEERIQTQVTVLPTVLEEETAPESADKKHTK